MSVEAPPPIPMRSTSSSSSGYINFTGFNTFGNSFEATVVRHGKRLMLMIDPRRHRIVAMP